MELARILRELWNQRRWVLVGAAVGLLAAALTGYRLQLFPPSAESKSYEYGSAQTQVLIESPRSTLADLGRDPEPLNQRAKIYAQFMTSPAVIELVGREARIPREAIVATGPFNPNQIRQAREPSAERRGVDLAGEDVGYRAQFNVEEDLPIVTIYTQGPSAEAARKLANAAVRVLKAYVARIQAEQEVASNRRVEIRQLGAAEGELVNAGADTKLALIVFLAVLAGWCVAVLVASSVARSWRQLDREAEAGRSNGSVASPQPERLEETIERPRSGL